MFYYEYVARRNISIS